MADLRFSLSHPLAVTAQPVSSGIGSGDCPVKLSDILRGRPVDLDKMRCMAPAQWAQMIRSGTRNSTEAAWLLSVNEKTARNWLEQTNEPRWSTVAAVLRELPPAERLRVVNFLLAEAA